LLDGRGEIVNRYKYDAFGNTIEAVEKVHNRFRYAGEQFDPVTGQYYLRARFYNPVIGRFTQEDTYRGDGLNLYAYVQNNPVKYYDPSGYCAAKSDLYERTSNNEGERVGEFKTDFIVAPGGVVFKTEDFTNMIIKEQDGIKTLYHYTDETGLKGILNSQKLNPSLKAINPKDARYGNGQYFSDIVPGSKTPAQLSRQFIKNPFQGRRFTHYIEVDVTGLNVIKGREGVYVVLGEEPLDLVNRIVSSGKVNI